MIEDILPPIIFSSNESQQTQLVHLFAVRYLSSELPFDNIYSYALLKRDSIVAGYTVLLYDILLTFCDEIRYVWHESHLPLTRLAYVVNRYGMVCLAMLYLFSKIFSSLCLQVIQRT